METLVERKLLGMSLQQLELRCTSNTVHYVLNEEDSKDPLLISNELKKVLSKTPKFRPTPNVVKSSDTMEVATNIAKRKLRIPQNLLPSERKSFRTVLNKNVGFNNSDKNFGPVLYSRNLYLEQCQKHLFDGSGNQYSQAETPNTTESSPFREKIVSYGAE